MATPAGPADNQEPKRSKMIPIVVGTAVLALLAGFGSFFAVTRLGGGGDEPSGIATGNGSPTTSATAAPTTAATATAATTTSAPTTPSGDQTTTQQPTGPQIVYFRVKNQPQCPSGTNVTQSPNIPLVIEWKVTGADSTELAVDGPGLYGAYGLQGSATFTFSCGGTPGTYETHTYTLTTVGGEAAKSKKLTVKALINEITNV